MRKASQYLVCIHLSQQVLQSQGLKSLLPLLFPLSQRKRTHQLCLEWRGPVTFLPIDRSNPGGTREEGRGDEQFEEATNPLTTERQLLCWLAPPLSLPSPPLLPVWGGLICQQRAPPCERFMALCLLLCSFPAFRCKAGPVFFPPPSLSLCTGHQGILWYKIYNIKKNPSTVLLHPCIIRIMALRGKPCGKWFLLLDSICWPALKLAENPCTAPPSSPLPRLFHHKWSQWLTRNSGIEWSRTEVSLLCALGTTPQECPSSRWGSLGCKPPTPQTFERFHSLFVYFQVPLLTSDQTSDRSCSLSLFFKTCFRERMPLWELPLLRSWPKQEISVLTCFCVLLCRKKGRR